MAETFPNKDVIQMIQEATLLSANTISVNVWQRWSVDWRRLTPLMSMMRTVSKVWNNVAQTKTFNPSYQLRRLENMANMKVEWFDKGITIPTEELVGDEPSVCPEAGVFMMYIFHNAHTISRLNYIHVLACRNMVYMYYTKLK
jgi:hypothetical protein